MCDKSEDARRTERTHDTRGACVASGEERGATERWDRREGGRERTEERGGMDTERGAEQGVRAEHRTMMRHTGNATGEICD